MKIPEDPPAWVARYVRGTPENAEAIRRAKHPNGFNRRINEMAIQGEITDAEADEWLNRD